MAGGGRRQTLRDVATRAGTSVPTVSKVLRGGTDVSERTRDQVMEAARSLGYVARATRQGRSSALSLIDFVVSDMHGTWAHEALSGVEEAATEADHDVVLTISRREGGWAHRVLRRRSAGVVIALVDATTEQLDLLRAAGRPFVLIDPMSRPPAYAASVGVTNWDGGRAAAEHLLALGHRRFVAIGGTRTHLYSQARLDGFRSAVEAQPGAELVGTGWADWLREPAGEVASDLLRRHRPTAVFCCNDLMAVGVCDAAASLGLRVPQDLSVVGFDDVPEAAWLTPQLTTVRQPTAELGAAAVRMLLRMSGDGSGPPPHIDLATRLVERASTAAAPVA
ncbi:LacI family DNA-binding transcriptional regulator [Amnibacterium endophyticum]|uniref:LacI family DNA-binding transcriptional regulator n=1 Tax=Amnibacterium endophyticum TaxID=2109337 RepID=A0ABW4LCU3_9MICO